MTSTKPPAEHCPLPSCSALVEPHRANGSWQCTCNGPHPTGQPFVWTPESQMGIEPTVPSWEQPKSLSAAQKAKLEKDAVTENLLGPFRKFFEHEHQLVEHGVIEDWLRTKHFSIYKQHIDEVGHRLFGKPPTWQPTASNRALRT